MQGGKTLIISRSTVLAVRARETESVAIGKKGYQGSRVRPRIRKSESVDIVKRDYRALA